MENRRHNDKELQDEMKAIREDLKEIKDIFTAFGKGKQFIIALAIIIGSIVGIGVGLKTILGWLK